MDKFTNAQIADMFRMRLDGYSYKQISVYYQTTPQTVRYHIPFVPKKSCTYDKTYSNIVYKNLAYWMMKNDYSVKRFAEELNVSSFKIRKFLYGGYDEPPDEIIRGILRITGGNAEDVFYPYAKVISLDEPYKTTLTDE